MKTTMRPAPSRVAVCLAWCAALAAGCAEDPLHVVLFHDAGPSADVVQDWHLSPDQQRGDSDVRDGMSFPDISYDACIARPEACNNVDDNCNGQVDEGLDKLSDIHYCEACKGCLWLIPLHASPECVNGSCGIQDCAMGYVNRDGKISNGCEYGCTKTGPEICDGTDNDCNGKIDDGVSLSQPICKDLGPCAGATATCEGVDGWVCQYGPDVELHSCSTDADCGAGKRCVSGVCPGVVAVDELLCDGKDGDCDGAPDDPWSGPGEATALGSFCTPDPSKLGICQAQGVYACDASQTGVVCQVTQPGEQPTDEVCNGLDDDCDGKIDENEDDAAGQGVTDPMVRVTRTVGGTSYDFYIYAYEAARPDATAGSPGASTARACSKAGVLPWTQVTFGEAEAACQAAGARLCSGEEWAVACTGPSSMVFPYGSTYQATACNGLDASTGAVVATGTFSGCEGGDAGLFDMSGNVREWTTEKSGTTGGTTPRDIYVVRGGAYHTPAPGLTCGFDLSQAVEDVVLPAVGFRCCAD